MRGSGPSIITWSASTSSATFRTNGRNASRTWSGHRRMPRSVLMTADAVGGVWTYALELTRTLGRHGVHVSLAVLGPPPDADQRAAASALPNLQLFEHDGR